MKKRIVGAAVLISLLVILLPLAFKGPVEHSVEEVPLERPLPPFESIEKPAVIEPETPQIPNSTGSQSIASVAQSQGPVSEGFEQVLSPASSGVSDVQLVEQTGLQQGADQKSEPLSSALSNAVTEVRSDKQTPVRTVEQGVTTKKIQVTEAVERVQLEKTAVASGWVVQVGSFSSQTKAQTLQEALKRSAIATTITPVIIGATTFYRVRVMPPGEKAAVEAMAERLRQSHKLETLVVRNDG